MDAPETGPCKPGATMITPTIDPEPEPEHEKEKKETEPAPELEPEQPKTVEASRLKADDDEASSVYSAGSCCDAHPELCKPLSPQPGPRTEVVAFHAPGMYGRKLIIHQLMGLFCDISRILLIFTGAGTEQRPIRGRPTTGTSSPQSGCSRGLTPRCSAWLIASGSGCLTGR